MIPVDDGWRGEQVAARGDVWHITMNVQQGRVRIVGGRSGNRGGSLVLFTRVFLLLAFLLLPISSSCAAHPSKIEDSPFLRIRIAITPGKPNAPTEAVVWTRSEAGVQVDVSRITPEGDVLMSAKAAATEDAIREIWRAADPLPFEAASEGRGDRVFDYGQREVQLTAGTHEHDAATRSLSWIQPVGEEDQFDALLKVVGNRLRELGLDASMAYFP